MEESLEPRRRRPLRRGVAFFVVTLGALALFVITAPEIGLTWDEPAYIVAARAHAGWFGRLISDPLEALSADEISRYWAPNHEHPPLDKVLSGLVWAGAQSFLEPLVAHRLGNMLLASVLVGSLYLLGARAYGEIAGLAAAGALIAMPRFFLHAHLAALDVPVASWIFFTTALFWRTAENPSWLIDLGLGLVFGATLATKLNAFLLPPTLLIWLVLFRRDGRLFLRLALMSIVGACFAVAIWPWLYNDTVFRLADYLKFMFFTHLDLGVWYLGAFHMPPPWHYAFVITWAVMPLTLAILCLVGGVRAARPGEGKGGLGKLLVISALAPQLALASGGSLVYDGERLFMPSFPFLAMLAGLGFAWIVDRIEGVARRMKRPRWTPALGGLAGAMVLLPVVIGSARVYPHLLSYYSEGVGGLPGATRLGLETTYWAETYAAALPYLNEHAQSGDVVWVEPWSHDVMIYYQLIDELRPDLAITFPPDDATAFEGIARVTHASYDDADLVVFEYRQSYLGGYTEPHPITVEWLDGQTPVFQLISQGVPLMAIYEGRRSSDEQGSSRPSADAAHLPEVSEGQAARGESRSEVPGPLDVLCRLNDSPVLISPPSHRYTCFQDPA
jgi:4-amino-4-deoxy-L-arabinose transferase-like glycosyltransferase